MAGADPWTQRYSIMNLLIGPERICCLQITAAKILQQQDKWCLQDRLAVTNMASDSKCELGPYFQVFHQINLGILRVNGAVCHCYIYCSYSIYMWQSPVLTTLYIKLFLNEYGWFRANTGFLMWGVVVICMFRLGENGNVPVFWPQNNETLIWNPHLCSWERVSSQINEVSF